SYGSATLLCAFWARARRARKIGAGTFYPAPRVESSVLELEPAPVAEPEVYPQYRAWVRRLFQSPRKQLRKILRDALGPDRAQDALELGGWEPDQRPSSLRVAEILRLAARFSLDGH
ncbi:MAG: rRNA adenine N-6-methyltransferase family protein, partial [Planctomycetota bacterium]